MAENDGPIDLEFLKDLSDDPAELREVVGLYFEQTQERIEALQKAVAAQNADEVMRISHTCAGSSGMYGMKDIAPAFRQLEFYAKAKDLACAPELTVKICAEFKRLEAYWAEYQKKM